MKNSNLLNRLLSYSHEKQKMRGMRRGAAMLLLLVMCVTHAWAWDAMVCRSTAGGKIATKTVGDKLNNGNEWNYTYTTNGGWSSGDEIQVYVGTSTSSYTTVNAGWVSDGSDNNKNVAANIGNVQFDKSGLWYAVGRYKTAYTTTNSSWTSNTTFSMGSNSEPYWQVNPPALGSASKSSNGTSGSGTSGSPYLKAKGSTIRISISDASAPTDVNSALYVSFDGGTTYSSTTYIDIELDDTEKHSVAIKAKYYNSSASLSGTVYDFGDVYYQGTLVPSLTWAVSDPVSPTTAIAGEDITLKVTRANSTADITYSYSTNSGSTWTSIETTSAQTCTFTTPANTGLTQSYIFKAEMTDGGTKSTGNSSAVTVYGKRVFYIKNNKDWGTLYLYAYTGETKWNGNWPGTSGDGSNGFAINQMEPNSKWWKVTITSQCSNYIINNGSSGDGNQTTGIGYSEYANGVYKGCYNTSTGKFDSETTPSTPTLSTSAASTIREQSATMGGSVSALGNDIIVERGYYYSTNSSLSSSNLGGATKVVVSGTQDNTGAFSSNKTGLSAGTTYYVIAYAKNGFNTGYGSKVNFTTLSTWSVAVSSENTDKGTVNTASVTAGQYLESSSISATAKDGYKFKQWSATSPATLVSSATTNPNTVKTTNTGGAVQAQFDYRWVLRGSINSSNDQHGMPGWTTTTDYFTGISSGGKTGTISVTLEAKTKYKFKVYDLVSGHYYSKASTDWSGSNNTNTTENVEPAITFTTTAPGPYTFTFNFDTKNIAIAYPTAYSVTYGYGTGGSTISATSGGASIGSSPGYAVSGEDITFSQTPATGYTFKGWYTAASAGSAIACMAEDNVYDDIAGNINVYAQYTADHYSDTDNLLNTDESTAGGYNVDYDATSIVFTTGYVPSKTGYEIEGFYTNAGCTIKVANANRSLTLSTTSYTSGGKWKYEGAPNLYINWRAKTYTVKLDKNGTSSGYLTDGSATATYDSDHLTSITLPTRTGYHVPAGSTGAFYEDDELSIPIATKVGELNDDIYGYTDGVGNWTRDDGATLYTKWEANRYTVRYNDNHENYIGYASGSTTAQYPHYDDPAFTLRRNGFRLAGYSFLGWATTPTGDKAYDDEEEVSNLTSEENGVYNLYALWDPQPVTVSFYVGSGSCATTSTTVVMGENYGTGTGLSGSLPTPTPAEGYVFTGWKDLSGNSITSSTQLTNGNDHTLYAQYSQISYVYFYDNLGWGDNVYVTYDAYWNNTKGTGNQDRIYHKMTLVDGTTNIYRDEIPASVLGSWKGWIAFNNEKLGTIGDDGGYDDFNSGKVVFRHDFDSYATMFVPDPTDSFKKEWSGNYAWYYSTTWEEDKTGDVVTNYRHTRGYWTQYNTTNSGYVMKGNWDGWNKDSYFHTSNSGEMTYTTTKPLAAGTTYQFLVYKHCTTTTTHSSTFTNTSASAITSAACTNLTFRTENTATGSTRNSQITTTVAGDYKFTLTCGTDGVLKLSVRYPVAAGDYRVVYEWNDGDDHAHVSEVIQAEPETEKKMTFFVHKAEKVSSQALKIQKCTSVVGSTATWTDDKDNSGAADAPIDLSDVTESGLYNFIITQPASGEPTGAYEEVYDGPVYLRSDANSGSWDSYTGYLNRMTYSPYSLTQELSAPYSHYYCTYIDDAITNVAFTVATDYSPSICDTLVGDNIIGTTPDGPVYKHLPSGHPANIRFTWNQEDNSITRSYLKSAQGDGNKRYLVLHGKDDHILDSSGATISGEGAGADQLHENELLFVDQKDWIYQVNLKAIPIAEVSLIAKYNNADRYLVGGSSTYETILGADEDGETPYPLTAIYDFKTNRLMVAWTPDETEINDDLKDIDMLWVRHASNLGPQAATQINIGTGSLKDVAIVGAIEFQYNEIVGNVYSWTQSTRNLLKHFVSFPFDVKVADIFGLNGSELGREYVIQKYNGAKRAEKGLFGGDGSYFWEYLTADSIMHAGEGYIVMMDNDYIGNRYHDMWENKSGSDKIYLYFPASKPINIVNDDSEVVVPRHTCTIDKKFIVDGKELNHKNTDSHWNIIGSPFFHNSYIKTSGSGATAADTAMSAYYYLDYSYNEWRTAAVTRSTMFKAMSAVMVQWQGPATWTIEAPASVAARRMNEPETNLLKLELLRNDQTADWVFVEMQEGANADFVLCEDLYKITSSRTPSIYAFAGDYNVSYSKVPVENQIIPLGVIILQNGTYTFSIPSNFNGTMTLIDKFAQTRTNLALDDYEVYLESGTINDRFELEIDIHNAPTAIDGASDGQGSLKDGKAHKFIMNDMLYILKDGVIYDARGNRVK